MRKPQKKSSIGDTFTISPQLGEDLPNLVWQDITPQRANQILASAVSGDIQSQHELFGLMIDTWPRLSKALAEVSNAVRRITWNVDASIEDDEEEPSDEAKAHAALVRLAMRSWRPSIGTNELSFEDAIDQLMDARARGVSVCELVWHSTAKGTLPRAGQWVSPHHYGWDPRGMSLGLIGEAAWQPFTEDKFLVGIWRARAGAPVATAMLRPLVPYWVGRTFGWKWLLRTAQVFGVPFRWANYDASQPEVGAKVAAMLKNLGSAGWAAFPSGTTLEFKEAVTNARDNPQVLLQEMGDQACDLLILGQTLSSTSQAAGLGSSTANLHGSVRQEILQAAAWWVADLLNYQFVPAVLRLNFGEGIIDMPKIAPDLSMPTDPKALAERDAILAEKLGMKLPKKWAHERHGVPLPDDDDELLDGPKAAQPSPVQIPPQDLSQNKAGQEPGELSSIKSDEKTLQGSFAGFRGASQNQDQMQPDRPGRPTARFFEELTGMEGRFLTPVAPILERLLALAESGDVEPFRFDEALQEARKALPEIFDHIDLNEMETALRQTMAAEMVNGAALAIRK